MILGEHHEPLRRHVLHSRRPEAPPAKGGIDAIVNVRAVEGLGQVSHVTKVRVVAVAFGGHERAQGVVEVIGPRSVASVAAVHRAHHPWVVEAALGNHERIGPDPMDPPRHGLDDVLGARVEDGVYRVEPQAVDPEVADPAGGAPEAPTRAPGRTPGWSWLMARPHGCHRHR